MINENRKYNLNQYNRAQRQKSGKEQRMVSGLQKAFIGLGSTATVLALILAGAFLGRLGRKDGGDTRLVGTVGTEATGETTDFVATFQTDATTTEFTVTESLPANALADSYWGPLQECPDPVPYEHVPVHGLYLNAAMYLDQNLTLIENSELDTVVIDLKESDGIYYQTANPTALSVGSGYVRSIINLPAVCQECHSRGARVIGRIVCFKDPIFAAAYPDRAVCDSTGEPLHFSNEGDETFLSPYDSRNWDYLIELAEEAIAQGVDEIQFDYVRFPTGSSTSGNSPYFGPENEVPTKADAINRFLQTARIRIQDTLGVPVSADVFGIAVTSTLDGEILGQDWETMGFAGVDSLCPMIYPSHYALGTYLNGRSYDTPDKYPYDIMYNALEIGSRRHGREGYSTVRPYIQAFTASYIGAGNYMEYDYTAINDQIRAVQDAGLSEYILWNAACEYPEGNYSGNNG